MTSKLAQLTERIHALEAEAAELMKQRATVVRQVAKLVTVYSITAAEIGLAGAKPAKAKPATQSNRLRGPQPIKYRNAEGKTWTGIGKHPGWVRELLAAGGDLESFRIDPAP